MNNANHSKFGLWYKNTWAGSLNQGSATAPSEPILKVDDLVEK